MNHPFNKIGYFKIKLAQIWFYKHNKRHMIRLQGAGTEGSISSSNMWVTCRSMPFLLEQTSRRGSVSCSTTGARPGNVSDTDTTLLLWTGALVHIFTQMAHSYTCIYLYSYTCVYLYSYTVIHLYSYTGIHL